MRLCRTYRIGEQQRDGTDEMLPLVGHNSLEKFYTYNMRSD